MPYLANKIIEQGLGGIEYLVSVPGTIGGGIVMNAGQGKGGDTISQHVEKVRYYDGRSIQEESAADLKFENRYSIFQEHTDWIILSATFKFSNQPPEIGQKKIKQRAKKIDDRERALPNAGSVFKSGNLLPNLGFRVGGAKYCHGNRICNVDNASFDDAMSLIKYTRLFHRVIPFINVPEVEIRVWE
jgi:UDP-N-acetylmuramate dehydrogenase